MKRDWIINIYTRFYGRKYIIFQVLYTFYGHVKSAAKRDSERNKSSVTDPDDFAPDPDPD